MGQTGRTSSHTHHGHKGLLHVLMGTVHAHIGKRVHKHRYSYLQGRVSTFIYWAYRHMHSCSGHFTCVWDYLGTNRHCTHWATCARAPNGSQTHLYLFGSSRESLLMDSLQSLCSPYRSNPLLSIYALQHSLLMILHTPPCSAGLASLSRPCSLVTPCFQP